MMSMVQHSGVDSTVNFWLPRRKLCQSNDATSFEGRNPPNLINLAKVMEATLVGIYDETTTAEQKRPYH